MITERSGLLKAHWATDTSQPVMETTAGGVLQAAAERTRGRTARRSQLMPLAMRERI